jgi:electron transfer flavoprotein alpha subunit
MALVFSESKVLGEELASGAANVAAKAGRSVTLATIAAGELSAGSDAVAAALAKAVEASGAKMVLIPATRRGKEIGGYLAGLLGCGVIGEVRAIDHAPAGFVFTRGLYGGRFEARIRGLSEKGVVLVLPRALEPTGPAAAKTIAISTAGLASKSRRVEVRPAAKSAESIEDAKVIVAGGRGVKKKEDFALLEELARATGGMVGCSRPIAQDLRWLSADHWVGLSGHKVRPRLYFACGISGQVQHLAGIGDAKVVVAVNSDANAPIFQNADYGIVGDLYQVIPAITKRVKSR